MTQPETTGSPSEQPTDMADAIKKLRDEFAEQFAALKASFEQSTADKDAQIAKLVEENDALHRSLVRSAQMPQPEKPEPTAQELYDAEIKTLAGKTLEYMKRYYE